MKVVWVKRGGRGIEELATDDWRRELTGGSRVSHRREQLRLSVGGGEEG